MSALSAHEVTTGYGQLRAIADVSLEVSSGEIVALLGRNGAGKSTFVNAAAGLLPLWSGSIRLDGQPLERMTAHRRAGLGLATVLDGKRVFHSQSVAQNLALVKLPKEARTRESVDDLIPDLFPVLSEHSSRRAGSLSGGQQQMLLIAQALTMRPRMLILDEPSAGLAPALVEQLFESLRVLVDRGIGVLLVEQLLDQTLRIADRAMVLDLGRLKGEWEVTPQAAPEIYDALRLAGSQTAARSAPEQGGDQFE